jgi:membrane-bound inhibitor of C-type lysozyme
MKKLVLLALPLAALAGCASEPPPPPPAPAPVVQAPPPPPTHTATYACRHSKTPLTAVFTDGTPATVALSYGDMSSSATQVASKTGSLYKGDGVTFYTNKSSATVTMGKKKLYCHATS